MLIEVKLPRIGEGEGLFEVGVTKVLVAVGDRLERDQAYMEVASEKADIELPSPHKGEVVEVAARVGETKRVDDLLLVLESDEPPELAKKGDESANVRTALQHLTSVNPDYLCRRPELGDWKFDECRSFIEQIVYLSRRYRHLPLEELDEPLIRYLQRVLYFVSSFVRQLRRFDPDGVAAAVDHAKITRSILEDKEEALQRFSDVLQRAARPAHVGEPAQVVHEEPFDESGAYVFIAYSHDDQEFALRFAQRLAWESIPHFIDVLSIPWGDEIPEHIHRALERATHMVVLISPGSEQSAWVSYEVGFAKARGIHLIPYLLHPSSEPPGFLKDNLYLKGRDQEPSVFATFKSYQRPARSPEPTASLFTEWDPAPVRERLRTAKEICHQAVANLSFLKDCATSLIEVVRGGGSLRCVLLSPHGEAIKMATHRHLGMPHDRGFVAGEQFLAWQLLKEITTHARSGGSVQLKVIDYLLEPIMTIIDPQTEEGAMSVTLSGFEQSLSARPSFVLRRTSDPKWFEFYHNSFERLWTHPECKPVNLKSGTIGDEPEGSARSGSIKRRRKAARLAQPPGAEATFPQQALKGTLEVSEGMDLLAPVLDPDEWEAESAGERDDRP